MEDASRSARLGKGSDIQSPACDRLVLFAESAAGLLREAYGAATVVVAVRSGGTSAVVGASPQTTAVPWQLPWRAWQAVLLLSACGEMPSLLPPAGADEGLLNLRRLVGTREVLNVPFRQGGQYLGSALVGDPVPATDERALAERHRTVDLIAQMLGSCVDWFSTDGVPFEADSQLLSFRTGIASSTHRLKESLAVTLGETQLALRGEPPPAVRNALMKAERATMAAASICSKLAQAAAEPPGQQQEGLVDVAELVREMLPLSSCSSACGPEGDVACTPEIELTDTPLVRGDRNQLIDLFRRLLESGIRAAQPGGRVRVKTFVDQLHVMLSVRVSGSVSEQSLPGLECDATTPELRPHDSMLQLCREIVEGHGGNVIVEEPAELEVVLTLQFPRLYSCEFEPEERAGTFEPASGRALIVDDDTQLLGTLVRSIAALGMSADSASSGREALERLNTRQYDLLVTDVGMPDIDGRQVAAAAKSLRAGMPVVLLTGLGEQIRAVDSACCDAILEKPVSLDELASVFGRLLRSERARSA